MPMPTKLLNHVIFFALIYQNHIKTICSLETVRKQRPKAFKLFLMPASTHRYIRSFGIPSHCFPRRRRLAKSACHSDWICIWNPPGSSSSPWCEHSIRDLTAQLPLKPGLNDLGYELSSNYRWQIAAVVAWLYIYIYFLRKNCKVQCLCLHKLTFDKTCLLRCLCRSYWPKQPRGNVDRFSCCRMFRIFYDQDTLTNKADIRNPEVLTRAGRLKLA